MRPDLPLAHLQEELGFESKEELKEFILNRGGVIIDSTDSFDCKNSQTGFIQHEGGS